MKFVYSFKSKSGESCWLPKVAAPSALLLQVARTRSLRSLEVGGLWILSEYLS